MAQVPLVLDVPVAGLPEEPAPPVFSSAPPQGLRPPSSEALALVAPDWNALAPRGFQDLSGLAASAKPGGFFDGRGGSGKGGDWEFRFSFGPGRTDYFNTDIKVRSPQISGTFHNAGLAERTSMEYYVFWDKSQASNPLNWIDEPTNRFVFSAENRRRQYAVSLAVYHPKVLIADKVNEDVRFSGMIEGRPVDRIMDIQDFFSTWRLTKGLLDIEVQVEKIISLWRGKRGNGLALAPGAGVGGMVSESHVSYKGADADGEPISYSQGIKPIGYSASLSNRLTYTFLKGLLSLSLTYSLTAARIKYDFMDGKAEQNLNYQALALTLGARLPNLFKPKSKTEPSR